MKNRAYISLGSNFPDALAKLKSALHMLASLPGLELGKISPFFQTEPQIFHDQPWFYNAVAEIWLNNGLEPQVWLKKFQDIEKRHGRERSAETRYGPRPLDIDLLLFDSKCSEDPFCILPHPRMFERAFVLAPLALIEPALLVNDKSVAFLLSRLSWRLEGWKIYQD